MMKILKYILFSIFFLSFLACSNDQKKSVNDAKTAEAKETYTCPMHPQIVEDHPASCPICGMDLVKVNAQGKSKGLMLSDAQIKLANIKTQKIGSSNFENTKLINARLVINPLNTAIVSSKFAGRVDQLFYQEAGVKINKGEPIFKIYSEELLTLQKDYILNMKQQKAFPQENIYRNLLNASKNKLKLYGYSENQINKLATDQQTNPYITVYAPIGGVISEINLSEGQYVAEGSPVFKIENLNQLWVEADLYPSEIAGVKIGQSININVIGYENEPITSKIEFVSPQLESGSQIITIRANISNLSNKFQPGMQANLSLPYVSKNNIISLPNDAVLRDEKGNYIWVKTGENNFEIRMIEIGPENEKFVIVKSGIKNGDEVVITGAYLLSSELILKKGGIDLMMN